MQPAKETLLLVCMCGCCWATKACCMAFVSRQAVNRQGNGNYCVHPLPCLRVSGLQQAAMAHLKYLASFPHQPLSFLQPKTCSNVPLLLVSWNWDTGWMLVRWLSPPPATFYHGEGIQVLISSALICSLCLTAGSTRHSMVSTWPILPLPTTIVAGRQQWRHCPCQLATWCESTAHSAIHPALKWNNTIIQTLCLGGSTN